MHKNLKKYKIFLTIVLFLFSSNKLQADGAVDIKNYNVYCSGTVIIQYSQNNNSSIIGSNGTTNRTDVGQLAQYCQAAASNIAAMKARSTTWKVWAAVAGVCTLACGVGSWMKVGNITQYVCLATDIAGGATEAFETKQFASTLMEVMGTAVALLGTNYAVKSFSQNNESTQNTSNQSGADNKESTQNTSNQNGADNKESKTSTSLDGKPGAEEVPNKGALDLGSCVAASIAAYKSFSEHEAMKNYKTKAEKDLYSASLLSGTSAVVANPKATPSTTAVLPKTTLPTSTPPPSSFSGGSGVGSTQPKLFNVCDGNSISETLSCAVGTDPTIPPFVGNPEFLPNFNTSSGTDLAKFLQSAPNPTAALAQAMEGGGIIMDSDALAKLNLGIQKLGGSVRSTPEALYHGKKGGSASKTTANFKVNDMFSEILKKMGPAAEKTNTNPAKQELIFAYSKNPEMIPEKRELSIFYRISYRYFYNTYLWIQSGWTPPQTIPLNRRKIIDEIFQRSKLSHPVVTKLIKPMHYSKLPFSRFPSTFFKSKSKSKSKPKPKSH